MQSKFCVACGEEVWVVDGSHLLIDEQNKASLCYGPFLDKEPEGLEENWQDNLVAPDDEFMLISDQNADSLRLQFEGIL